jgi:GNAT superfamily N-acetyltransferase
MSTTAAGGTPLTIRAVQPSDKRGLARFYDGLSEHSRWMRFMHPVPALSPAQLRYLTEVDGDGHYAVLAFAGDECVAEARFIRLTEEPDVAEVAVAVTDRLQRRGVGRLLVGELCSRAGEVGIRSFLFLAHPMNKAAVAFMRSLGARPHLDDGLVTGHVVLGTRKWLADSA